MSEPLALMAGMAAAISGACATLTVLVYARCVERAAEARGTRHDAERLVRQAQRDVAAAFLHLTEPCGCGDYVEVTSFGDQAVLRKCMWCSREWAEPLERP